MMNYICAPVGDSKVYYLYKTMDCEAGNMPRITLAAEGGHKINIPLLTAVAASPFLATVLRERCCCAGDDVVVIVPWISTHIITMFVRFLMGELIRVNGVQDLVLLEELFVQFKIEFQSVEMTQDYNMSHNTRRRCTINSEKHTTIRRNSSLANTSADEPGNEDVIDVSFTGEKQNAEHIQIETDHRALQTLRNMTIQTKEKHRRPTKRGISANTRCTIDSVAHTTNQRNFSLASTFTKYVNESGNEDETDAVICNGEKQNDEHILVERDHGTADTTILSKEKHMRPAKRRITECQTSEQHVVDGESLLFMGRYTARTNETASPHAGSSNEQHVLDLTDEVFKKIPIVEQENNADAIITPTANDEISYIVVCEKPFTCDYCGKGFAQKSNCRIHVHAHTGQKPYKCDYCGKGFAQKSTCTVHERRHTGAKPFKCTYCGKGFTHITSCKNHELVHAGVKPFLCDYCGKSFTQKAQLIAHEHTHTGQKPFKCTYCGKGFTRKSSCKNHELVHEDVKPFLCDYCGKKFSEKSNCIVHQQIHMGQKSFTCNYCGKGFSQKGYCRIHERSHTS